METILLPHDAPVAALERDDGAVGSRHVDLVVVERESAIARYIAPPPHLARIERQHDQTPLVAHGVDIVARDAHCGVDISQALELGAPAGRAYLRLPESFTGRERHRHQLARVEP